LKPVISRRFSLWQKAVALAPLLFVAVYLPAEMMLRCRLDGMLRPTCCCPAMADAQDAAAAARGPTLEARDCCDPELSGSDRPIVEAAHPHEADATRTLIAVAHFAVTSLPHLASTARPAAAAQRYGPARQGPPIVLLKHAFLI